MWAASAPRKTAKATDSRLNHDLRQPRKLRHALSGWPRCNRPTIAATTVATNAPTASARERPPVTASISARPTPSCESTSSTVSERCAFDGVSSWASAASRWVGNGRCETKRVVGSVMAGLGEIWRNVFLEPLSFSDGKWAREKASKRERASLPLSHFPAFPPAVFRVLLLNSGRNFPRTFACSTTVMRMASFGQACTQAGASPAARRCEHKSHLRTMPRRSEYFGTL